MTAFDPDSADPPVLYTVGSGVEIRRSTTGFGNGLFATRPFEADEPITRYYGQFVLWRVARGMSPDETTHIAKHIPMRWNIDGLHKEDGTLITDPASQLVGLGGGAFANDARRTDFDVNADFDFWDNRMNKALFTLTGDLQPTDRITFLKATRHINAGEEVFVDYGANYWSIRERHCARCRRVDAPYACKQCESAFYCDSDCANQHWYDEHSHTCQAVAVPPPLPVDVKLGDVFKRIRNVFKKKNALGIREEDVPAYVRSLLPHELEVSEHDYAQRAGTLLAEAELDTFQLLLAKPTVVADIDSVISSKMLFNRFKIVTEADWVIRVVPAGTVLFKGVSVGMYDDGPLRAFRGIWFGTLPTALMYAFMGPFANGDRGKVVMYLVKHELKLIDMGVSSNILRLLQSTYDLPPIPENVGEGASPRLDEFLQRARNVYNGDNVRVAIDTAFPRPSMHAVHRHSVHEVDVLVADYVCLVTGATGWIHDVLPGLNHSEVMVCSTAYPALQRLDAEIRVDARPLYAGRGPAEVVLTEGPNRFREYGDVVNWPVEFDRVTYPTPYQRDRGRFTDNWI